MIQYLAAVATAANSASNSPRTVTSNLSQQILKANPILEAFGNAQTVRNNNSSRFGKFIRVQFTRSGQIAGALIDWYLLEKSRVVRVNSSERNYHIFYQLLRGADEKQKRDLMLSNMTARDFQYTRSGNETIAGVVDQNEWTSLMDAFRVMEFSDAEQMSILRCVAAVLHLGNVHVSKESLRAEQAALDEPALRHVDKACRLLGVSADSFVEALLHPRVRAGREWVQKAQTPDQVRLSIDALAKSIYERTFGDLVDRINQRLNRATSAIEESHFIGVLDIAGFEIFDENSFEQLCINYTNEKLQQFFNHHMFVLEQEEYAREQIEWQFIDFGRDLQPTIDMIELTNPIGLFSCLDEDSVMPKATDKSFTEKLHSLWDNQCPNYKRSLLRQGFTLTHYAAEVEYCTEGWLEKNKDPLNDNVTQLLAQSTDAHVVDLFADCVHAGDDMLASKTRIKKGLFRTVAQRHKEQLSTLMQQLHSTNPHFVRCILPNHKKRPKSFNAKLVLDQLRCNGVLEGIRIARTGFPNRLPFAEFRARYEVIYKGMPRGYVESREAAITILSKLNLDKSVYRVGLSKVFFRAGVLADLEEQRDALIREIFSRFQSVARGFLQRRAVNKRLYQAEAARIIQRNLQVYLTLQGNPWWRLFVRMRPLLGASRESAELKKREEAIKLLQDKIQQDLADRQRLDEERRKAENDVVKVQATLESERALALDKEEIFKRLQERETELNDKLLEAIDDQEALESQVDDLMLAKQKAEEKVNQVRQELDRAGQLIVALEEEKRNLMTQAEDLKSQLSEMHSHQSRNEDAEAALEQQIRVLSSQVALKDRKLQELETKTVKADQDLEVQVRYTTRELQAARKTATQLSSENINMKQQLAELVSASSSYEDKLRLKDSELMILRSEKATFESARRSLDEERLKISTQHEAVLRRARDVQAELEASRAEKAQLTREASDARRLLDQRLNDDVQSKTGRQMLEKQIEDLKAELFHIQAELSRERQSRDDVQMLSDHKLEALKQEYNALNQAKIIIEKELYIQQDVLRRTAEGRAAAEKERRERQDELRTLRQRFLKLQEEKLEADNDAERSNSRQAAERQANMQRDLAALEDLLQETEGDRTRLSNEVTKLRQLISDSDLYKLHHDQHKERLERELATIKGRLTASENDNRALLNKIQQKNLDLARSNSTASETQRKRITQLQAEKAARDGDDKKALRDLDEAQLMIKTLEQQKEKLALSLEDLAHEIEREHQTCRNAEKASSAASLQLAETNRKLETERQLRAQAQENTRTLQSNLDSANSELKESHEQLLVLAKICDPSTNSPQEILKRDTNSLPKTIDLARKLEDAEQAARVATERFAQAEAQLTILRERYADEMSELDGRHANSKRALLEELDQGQVNARRSPPSMRNYGENIRPFPNLSTPAPLTRKLSVAASETGHSVHTVDFSAYNNKMDLVSELEMIQNQLQMSEMRNKHLQYQLEHSPSKTAWEDDSPSVRRVTRLERENSRLHDMLDDSSKKVSSLENSIRAGQLSLKEVQTKSHEELFDLITSQENSRRTLLQVHNTAIAELSDAKVTVDELRHARAALEVDVRDFRSEMEEINYTREQEAVSRSQLLQEFSDLQIKLDTETSKLLDAQTNLGMYKSRADNYYNKLEQAEIAVLRASRAEQFAKSQVKEAEDASTTIYSERKQIENHVDDLQRQLQSYEERIEDMSADLDGALQAKKRLQNELEDYRSQRATDLEDKEMSVEQTRKKYQNELAVLNAELELERESVISVRGENSHLRDEIENLRAKWDEEALNSSTWAKEKARLELTLESVSNSRDEAASAHHEAQDKVVDLLSQVRALRASLEDAQAEGESLAKDKQSLEMRLSEASGRLDNLTRSNSPFIRNAADMDKEVLQLKADLAQHEDIASAAVDKMRRSEALAQEIQKDMVVSRDENVQLHKDKAGLEKSVKDLQLRLVDLETKGFSSAGQDNKFLSSRVQEVCHHHMLFTSLFNLSKA